MLKDFDANIKRRIKKLKYLLGGGSYKKGGKNAVPVVKNHKAD